MNEILFEYMTDAEKRLESCGEVTNPAFSDGQNFTDDGIMSPRIFGTKGESSCQCGKVHDDGAWCADCGTQAKEYPLGRMGHIELAAGWPEGFEMLLCDIIDLNTEFGDNITRDELFQELCNGNRSIEINGQMVSGVIELEKACRDIDLQDVITRLENKIDRLDSILSHASSTLNSGPSAAKAEDAIGQAEESLECVKAMQEMNLTPADLFTHVLLVLSAEERPILEIGTDPLGKDNRAYIEILQANNALKEELAHDTNDNSAVRKANFKKVLKNYADVMQKACGVLSGDFTGDKLKDKKGLGEELQKTRVANSTFAVAEVSKNLSIDSVAIPYNMLLFMYKDEVYKQLLENAQEKLKKASEKRALAEQDYENNKEENRKNKEECELEEEQAKRELEDIKQNARADIDKERYTGRTPKFEEALLQVINGPSWQGEEVEVPGKVVMVGRFPIVSRNSIVALKPVLSPYDHCISVNPAVCDRLGLDFDGDQLQVYKLKSPKVQEELWKASSPLYQPFSATSGQTLHANDREDALGVWIATRMDSPQDCNFQRDAVLTDLIGTVKDGVLETEGWVYSRHILWSGEEGFQKTAKESVVNPGDEIGKDKNGNTIKAPWFGILQETKEGYKLLSIPQDRVHLPRGAKLNFDFSDSEKDHTKLENILMPKGMAIADWNVMEVESVDIEQLYFKDGVLDANSAVYLQDADITTTAGRLMVAQMLTSGDSIPEELLTQRIGKKQIKDALGVLYEDIFQRDDLSLTEKAQIVMKRQEQLQALGSQFAQYYAGYSDYDALKYEPMRDDKGKIIGYKDQFFRFNSIKEQIESGAKGTQKNVDNFIKFVAGQDKILDAKEMAESVYKLDKSGKSNPMDGITPVQRTGYIQRILSEAMYNIVIEKDDCMTTRFESVGSSKDVVSQIKGRYLANDYTMGDGTVYAKGTLLSTTQAQEIAEDIKAHHEARIEKTVDIRTVSECLCNGSCAKCWGRSSVIPDAPKIGTKVGLEAVMALTSGITEQGNLKAIANSGTENAEAALILQNVLAGKDVYGGDTIRRTAKNPMQAQEQILRNLKTLVKETQLNIPSNYLELLAKSQIAVTFKTAEGRCKMGYGEFLRNMNQIREMLQTKKAKGFTLHLVSLMVRAKQTDRARFALAGKNAVRNMMTSGIRNKAKFQYRSDT